MPMNSAVREILPQKRLSWATRYSRSNTSRASRSGRLISFSPRTPVGVAGTSVADSAGSMSAVISPSGIARGQDHQPLDIVAQLADVARPVVQLQNGQRVVGDLTARHAGRQRHLFHEIFDQLGNVLAPLGQRGNADRHHDEPVEEVFAQRPLLDRRRQIAARTRR